MNNPLTSTSPVSIRAADADVQAYRSHHLPDRRGARRRHRAGSRRARAVDDAGAGRPPPGRRSGRSKPATSRSPRGGRGASPSTSSIWRWRTSSAPPASWKSSSPIIPSDPEALALLARTMVTSRTSAAKSALWSGCSTSSLRCRPRTACSRTIGSRAVRPRREPCCANCSASDLITANDAERLGLLLASTGDLYGARDALMRFDEIANPERTIGRLALFDVLVQIGDKSTALSKGASWTLTGARRAFTVRPTPSPPVVRLIRLMMALDETAARKAICDVQREEFGTISAGARSPLRRLRHRIGLLEIEMSRQYRHVERRAARCRPSEAPVSGIDPGSIPPMRMRRRSGLLGPARRRVRDPVRQSPCGSSIFWSAARERPIQSAVAAGHRAQSSSTASRPGLTSAIIADGAAIFGWPSAGADHRGHVRLYWPDRRRAGRHGPASRC